MELSKKLAELRPQLLNCNAFSIYDYPSTYSITELLCEFFKAINGCIEICNKTIDLTEWLVNEGLSLEVAKKLDSWLQDGTIQEILNEKIFKELNDKVDTNKSNIERIEREYKKADSDLKTEFKSYIHAHVNMYGAKGDGITDDILAIQKCIDDVKSKGGGVVEFGKGKYKISNAIYLPSEVTLQGEGMREGTTIVRALGGINQLSEQIDYKTITKEDFIRYEACIVVEPEGVYWNIKNMKLIADKESAWISWGVLAPWCSLFTIDSVQTERCNEHYRIFNAWNTNWNSIRMIRGSWGIRLQDAKTSNIDTACTSWSMNRVFAEYVSYGYDFTGLQYSSLNAICADQISKRAYAFKYCYGISINGMGCENSNGQIIKNKFSQLSIQGAFFLGMKGGDFPTDSISNSLIEIDTAGRAWCGIHMTESLFKNNNSGKKLLFISRDGNFSGIDIRVNDGTQLGDMEEGSVGGFSEDNVWNLELKNKTIKVKDIVVDQIESGYSNNSYKYYPSTFIYNNVGDSNQIQEIIIPRQKIKPCFSWVVGTDNYIWLPLKISVTSEFTGSCNHVWNAHNSVTSSGKIVLGTDIVESITTDASNLKIKLSSLKGRVKVVITLA